MKDELARFIARHLPKRLVMWCFLVVITHATTGKYGYTNVPNLSAMCALSRYLKDFNL